MFHTTEQDGEKQGKERLGPVNPVEKPEIISILLGTVAQSQQLKR
jgi:hypothetical protein